MSEYHTGRGVRIATALAVLLILACLVFGVWMARPERSLRDMREPEVTIPTISSSSTVP